MADLHFCKQCDSLLEYRNTEEGDVNLVCSYCGDVTRPEGLKVHIINKRGGDSTTGVTFVDMAHDLTLRRTSYFKCPNPVCPSHEPLAEGGVIPSAGMFNYFNTNRKLGLICHHCKYVSTVSEEQ